MAPIDLPFPPLPANENELPLRSILLVGAVGDGGAVTKFDAPRVLQIPLDLIQPPPR